jgi:hypothetical protein
VQLQPDLRTLRLRTDRRRLLHHLHQRRSTMLRADPEVLRMPQVLPRLRLHLLHHAEQHADLLLRQLLIPAKFDVTNRCRSTSGSSPEGVFTVRIELLPLRTVFLRPDSAR